MFMNHHLSAPATVVSGATGAILLATSVVFAAPARSAPELVVEAESWARSAALSGGELITQDMQPFGSGWGAGAQLFWRPPAPVDGPVRNWPELRAALEVPAAGSYEILVHHTVAADYGRFRVSLGDEPVAEVNGYAPDVALRSVSLGTRTLAAAGHQMVFTVFGKDASSSGYLVGLDRVELRPAGGTGGAPRAGDPESTAATKAMLLPSGVKLADTRAEVSVEALMAVKLDPLDDPEKSTPTLRLVAFHPMRPYAQDYQCWVMATKDLTGQPMWKKRQRRYRCKRSSSGGGGLGGFAKGFVSGFIDNLGTFADHARSSVNQFSALYADAKAGALDLAASAVPGCPPECRWAMAVGLDAALASAGVPPSLPDFDQAVADLRQDGIDAAVRTAARAAESQGVPGPVAEEAAKRAVTHVVQEATKRLSSGGGAAGGRGDWVPDPNRSYRPAVLLLELTNHDKFRPTPKLTVSVTHPNPQKVALPAYRRAPSPPLSGPIGGYEIEVLRFPPLAPGSSLPFLVTLRPSDDPHHWLELLKQADPISLNAHRTCGPEPTDWMTSSKPKQVAFRNCVHKEHQKASDMRTTAYQLPKLWAQAYTTGEQRFNIGLFVHGAVSQANLRCPPKGGDCVIDYPAPEWQDKRLDFCRSLGRNCGEPAATAFCRKLGYKRRSAGMTREGDVGARSPTVALGDGKVCANADCDAFGSISCVPGRELE